MIDSNHDWMRPFRPAIALIAIDAAAPYTPAEIHSDGIGERKHD